MTALAQKQRNSSDKEIVRNVNTLVASRMALMFEIAREAASLQPNSPRKLSKKPKIEAKE